MQILRNPDRRLRDRQQVSQFLRVHGPAPDHRAHFKIVVADLKGDDEELSHTRHVETALRDQPALTIVGANSSSRLAEVRRRSEGAIAPQERASYVLAAHNRDVLMFGEVAEAKPHLRLHFVGRYEGVVGRHGPYQLGAAELPKRFGPDFEGQLLALVGLSVASAIDSPPGRKHLIALLRPAAIKLTRLLEHPPHNLGSGQHGALWHALGLTASVLGEQTGDRRWLEAAIQAYHAVLHVWGRDANLFDRAMVQNNLGHTLGLLAARSEEDGVARKHLVAARDAFCEALQVYRTARASAHIAHTEANLAGIGAVQIKPSLRAVT